MNVTLASLLMVSVSVGSIAAAERFACNMKALTSAERTHHQGLSKTLFAAVQEKRELPNGYAFRLPPGELMRVAEWVSAERKCCPFLAFEIEQPADQSPLWLHVTGAKGVKAFIADEFQL